MSKAKALGNWLDRAISFVSPVRGARRIHARLAISTLGYEGARGGRRTEGWVTTSGSADSVSSMALSTLRERARDLVRNNAYAARAIEVKVANTIGTGIVGEVKNEKVRPLWDRWVENCDADGELDLYGIQALAERCRMESGEVLIRFQPVAATDMGDSPIPLKLRVLEPDFLDTSKDGSAENGNVIQYGIEYNAAGMRVAYHIYREHPGDSSGTALMRYRSGILSDRVPASQVLHLYRKLRPQQRRGVTDFAPVMLRMRDLDDYDDAELMRKKLEACLSAFVTTADTGDDARLSPVVSTDDVGRVETLYPAMVSYLKPGESIEMTDPKTSGGYADFQRFSLHAIASGVGVPYELMTGDLSTVNYSSYRAGLVDFRRRVEQDQWLLYVPRLCEPVWRAFIAEVAALNGNLGMRTRIEWTPPRFELIDPLKETQAELEACLSGFDSWEEIIRRRGWTATEQLDAIERWQKELDRRGIVLKSDYRQHADKTESDDSAQRTEAA